MDANRRTTRGTVCRWTRLRNYLTREGLRFFTTFYLLTTNYEFNTVDYVGRLYVIYITCYRRLYLCRTFMVSEDRVGPDRIYLLERRMTMIMTI